MFGALALEIKEIGHLDPDALADDELSEVVVELARRRAAFDAAEARLLAAWNRRRAWADDGARSGAAWLARKTRRPKAECGGRVWLGRSMSDLPVATEAWMAGEICSAHVRSLARARNRRTEQALARDESMLVEHARSLTFAEFTQVLDYWLVHADPDGAELSDIERRVRRRVSFDRTFTGMWSGSVLFDPINGEIVATELERLERAMFDDDRAEAKARLGRDAMAGELSRTADQRRADALVEMARRSATAAADGKAPRPLFKVVVGNDALSHLMQLASGQVVSPEALLPWISGADLERYLFDGGRSRVIDVSYKRTFTGALRDLIEVRDRLCFHEYCDEPAHRCQVDHIEPWTAGGITSQENGRLACGFHNRLRHRRRPPPDG